jgi:hypothetical protein
MTVELPIQAWGSRIIPTTVGFCGDGAEPLDPLDSSPMIECDPDLCAERLSVESGSAAGEYVVSRTSGEVVFRTVPPRAPSHPWSTVEPDPPPVFDAVICPTAGVCSPLSEYPRLSFADISSRAVQGGIESRSLDLFFIGGGSIQSIGTEYRRLTGVPPLPPLWSYGTWMARMSYFSAGEALRRVRRASVGIKVRRRARVYDRLHQSGSGGMVYGNLKTPSENGGRRYKARFRRDDRHAGHLPR